MVSTLRFVTNYTDLEEEIKRRTDLAEESKREKYIAARKIQAYVRGFLTRNHLRMLHEKAAIIQKYWRGYRVRVITDHNLIERVEQMWRDYYDLMARKIQTVWRGYRARKTGVNFRQMRHWLNDVYAKNREFTEDMKKFRQKEIERVRNMKEQESMQWILYVLFKLHHLLRTEQRPGVITRIDKTHSTSIEKMLKCLEYELYKPRRKNKCKDCLIDPKPSLVFRGTRYERCERQIREFERGVLSGHVSISRSDPYELRESLRKKTNDLREKLTVEEIRQVRMPFKGALNRRETEKIQASREEVNGGSHKATEKCNCSARKTNPHFSCLDASEIYDMIHQIDYYVNEACKTSSIHQ